MALEHPTILVHSAAASRGADTSDGSWIGPRRSRSCPPVALASTARASATIASATSGGVSAPMSSPTGQRNIDFWYEPPAFAGEHVRSGESELFTFELSATAAYCTEFAHKPARRWHEAARTKLDAVHQALTEGGCQSLTTEQRSAWHLVRRIAIRKKPGWRTASSTDRQEARRRSGWTVSRGSRSERARGSRRALDRRRESMEPKHIQLAFDRVPSPAVIAEIRSKLSAIVSTGGCLIENRAWSGHGPRRSCGIAHPCTPPLRTFDWA